jgi:preprotein translocase subunit YajC
MNGSELMSLLVFAQAAQPAQPFWTSLVMPALLIVIFYFALIRPQQQKAKQHAALLKAVRAGDRITTTSGIVGVVLSVKEKTLSIRSADSKFEITKSAVAEISERTAEASES